MENDFCTKVGMFKLFYQKGIKVPHGEKIDGCYVQDLGCNSFSIIVTSVAKPLF
jgi:hypothetical protein